MRCGARAGCTSCTRPTIATCSPAPELDAMVVAVGGGSQAVGALTVARALRPALRVYAVQATGASAMHDAVNSGNPRTYDRADTFADGIATRVPYELTYPPLREG